MQPIKTIMLLTALSIVTISFAQKKENKDQANNHRADITIGFANPKATQVFGQFYKSKGLQPRITVEYALLHLPYSNKLNARISAIAGLEPQSFTNLTTFLTEAKMTQKPIGGRLYPFAFRQDPFTALDYDKNGRKRELPWMVESSLLSTFWVLNGFYLEGGISPAVKITEEGYKDVTRSPTFTGWGFSFMDFLYENKWRFKFSMGTRKYTWTNASNTTSQIKSFCMDLGISYRLN